MNVKIVNFLLWAALAALTGCQTTGPGAPLSGAAQQVHPKPDLNRPWDSDYGRIHFAEGYYDTPGKTIAGQLYREGGKWFYEGRWGRTDSSRGGVVKFEFTRFGDGFYGSFTSRNGAERRSWNGRLARDAARPATETFPRQTATQRPQTVQSRQQVVIQHERPNLNVTWASDFGVIDFRRGFYKTTNQTLRGRLQRSGGQWIWRGRWGRVGSDAGGAVELTFSLDGRSFAGSYVGSDGRRAGWNGRMAPRKRIETVASNAPAPVSHNPARVAWSRDGAKGGRVVLLFRPDGRSFIGAYKASDGQWRRWNGSQ